MRAKPKHYAVTGDGVTACHLPGRRRGFLAPPHRVTCSRCRAFLAARERRARRAMAGAVRLIRGVAPTVAEAGLLAGLRRASVLARIGVDASQFPAMAAVIRSSGWVWRLEAFRDARGWR